MQGRSVIPALAGGNGRDYVFIQYDHQAPNAASGVPPRVHTLIDDRYRLSVFDGTHWCELYDLVDDPGEFENLWSEPAHAATRARLIEQLAFMSLEHTSPAPPPPPRPQPPR